MSYTLGVTIYDLSDDISVAVIDIFIALIPITTIIVALSLLHLNVVWMIFPYELCLL